MKKKKKEKKKKKKMRGQPSLGHMAHRLQGIQRGFEEARPRFSGEDSDTLEEIIAYVDELRRGLIEGDKAQRRFAAEERQRARDRERARRQRRHIDEQGSP